MTTNQVPLIRGMHLPGFVVWLVALLLRDIFQYTRPEKSGHLQAWACVCVFVLTIDVDFPWPVSVFWHSFVSLPASPFVGHGLKELGCGM